MLPNMDDMTVSVVEISQFDVLTNFMRGLNPQEVLLIVGMTKRGCDVCVVNDDEDQRLVTRWHLIRENGAGQIMSVSEALYEEWKANDFNSLD